jgi:hypothetical protein
MRAVGSNDLLGGVHQQTAVHYSHLSLFRQRKKH